MKRLTKYLLLIVVGFSIAACSGEDPGPENGGTESTDFPVQIVSPANSAEFVFGDKVQLELKVNKPEGVTDMSVELNGKTIAENLEVKDQTLEFDIDALGEVEIKLNYYVNGEYGGDTRYVDVYSDITPQKKAVNVVSTLKHDPSSYTQGLEFYKGKLFEGTGQWGKSKLVEADLMSGTVLRSLPIGEGLFGEGITVMDSMIYQLTWKAGRCFVYDMSFNMLKEYSYSGDGWGLCNDGTHLIMSNGSDEIVWRDPSTFQVVKRIQVFNHEQNFRDLNELELIEGKLFANIFMEDLIVEIDTATGKVLSEIDCKSVAAQQPQEADVLNGIAYNPLSGKMYITGKLWPSMYEVTFD